MPKERRSREGADGYGRKNQRKNEVSPNRPWRSREAMPAEFYDMFRWKTKLIKQKIGPIAANNSKLKVMDPYYHSTLATTPPLNIHQVSPQSAYPSSVLNRFQSKYKYILINDNHQHNRNQPKSLEKRPGYPWESLAKEIQKHRLLINPNLSCPYKITRQRHHELGISCGNNYGPKLTEEVDYYQPEKSEPSLESEEEIASDYYEAQDDERRLRYNSKFQYDERSSRCGPSRLSGGKGQKKKHKRSEMNINYSFDDPEECKYCSDSCAEAYLAKRKLQTRREMRKEQSLRSPLLLETPSSSSHGSIQSKKSKKASKMSLQQKMTPQPSTESSPVWQSPIVPPAPVWQPPTVSPAPVWQPPTTSPNTRSVPRSCNCCGENIEPKKLIRQSLCNNCKKKKRKKKCKKRARKTKYCKNQQSFRDKFRQCASGFRTTCKAGASCTDAIIKQFANTCDERAIMKDLAFEKGYCGYDGGFGRERDFSCVQGTSASRFGNCNVCSSCAACKNRMSAYTTCLMAAITIIYVIILVLISILTYYWLKTYQHGVNLDLITDFRIRNSSEPPWVRTGTSNNSIEDEYVPPWQEDYAPQYSTARSRKVKREIKKDPRLFGWFDWGNNPETTTVHSTRPTHMSSLFVHLNIHYLYSIFSFITLQGLSFVLFRIMPGAPKFCIGWIHMGLHVGSAWIMYLAYRPALKLKDFLHWPRLLHDYSVHAYLGHFCVILFLIQSVLGFIGFMFFPLANSAKPFRKYLGYFHQACGVVVYMSSVATCLTGLEETAIDLLRADYTLFDGESFLIKLIGILIGTTPLLLMLLLSRTFARPDQK